MRQTGIRQVERHVQFALCHGWIRRIHYHRTIPRMLKDTCCLVLVRFLFDIPEVFSFFLLVAQASFMRVEHDVFLFADAGWNGLLAFHHINRLGNIVWDERILLHLLAKLCNGLFSHAIYKQIGTRFYQDALAHHVLPIIVMGETSQRSFDTSDDDGYVRPKLLQDLGIDNGGIFRAHVMTSVRRIGILATQTLVGGILVHHGVHASGRYTEKQAWLTQLLEVSQVVTPIGLRDNCYFQSLSFEQSANDGSTERWMVYIRITAEQNDIEFIPSA